MPCFKKIDSEHLFLIVHKLKKTCERCNALRRQTNSYGSNYLEKFRKHAEQIRRTTGKKEIAKVSSTQGQEQIKTLIEEIVMTGETRQQRYMAIADALWSRKGNAIVIRQPNGEFVTFLEAGKGAALAWRD
jgi:hemerythrin-like domain-containing protein